VENRYNTDMSAPEFDEHGFSLIGSAQSNRKFVVLNDSPVGEGGNEDLLEAIETARNLAELIRDSRTAAPFTLAVDAGWGMGKSSLMRTLADVLERDPAVSTVWFNAWTAERASAMEGLIKSVLLSFDRNVIRRVVGGALRRAHVVGALRAASLVVSSFFGLRQVIDAMWRALALDAKSRNEIKSVVSSMAQAWLDKGDPDTGKRLLVVFIDDLDRCSDDRIFEVCEAIKLYLDVPGIVFVLACDQAVLWQAIGRSVDETDRTGSGIRYLEKIIQVNYPIPPPSSSLARKLVDGSIERSGTAHLFDDAMKTLLIERTGRNPRRIKRVINSFVLEHHLNRAWDELGPANLVKVILLQHFYPEMYGMLIDVKEGNPVRSFLDYCGFREFVKQGGERNEASWARLFTEAGLKPPAGVVSDAELASYLQRVEQELPVFFPELVTDKEFVSLLRSLPTGSAHWRRLLRKPLISDGHVVAANLSKPEPGSLLGARVLWIDDHPRSNVSLINAFVRDGAQVESVTNLDAAMAITASFRPTALISDVRRGDNPNAGFDDVESLQKNGDYRGPVFFFCGQETPSRLLRARELGARLTNDPGQLIDWVHHTVDEEPTRRGTRPPR
jgi:CheY-like chemotaxis protein